MTSFSEDGCNEKMSSFSADECNVKMSSFCNEGEMEYNSSMPHEPVGLCRCFKVLVIKLNRGV